MLHYFQKENFNMWVTSGSYLGHIQIVLWVSGSNGSIGVTRTIWVTWVTFLEGQVGIIRKLNYLNVTRISHVL